MVTRAELSSRLERAFLDHGYEHITMTGLAKAIDVTRRTLYNHISGKEDAFRLLIEDVNHRAVEQGMAAGRAALAEGSDVVTIVATILDTRYGHTRRRLASSPHAVELNDQAFRRCRDLMIASAVSFQSQLADFLVELQAANRLRLKPGISADEVAQLLADGARGTNQSLPPIAPDQIHLRYRAMVGALLHGLLETRS
ncbi:MAG: TetR/AcrR family transcriptional regulator [Beijerinckiaceae bacterium]|jgi:AcrR family transcriptional regulator|nr:TetR/AcrR family transcriptional regulator [Beijerinckiaceae bacterium]